MSRMNVPAFLLTLSLVLTLFGPLSDTLGGRIFGNVSGQSIENDPEFSGMTRSDPPLRTLNPAPRIEGLSYAAIGPLEFRDELEPLLEWKTQKGVRAVFFPLDGTGGIIDSYSGDGKDIQTIVREFLKALKEKNAGLQWILLAGDGEIIPPRMVFVNGSAENGADDPDNYVPSDFYYAGLDRERNGDWDLNDNGIYGENYKTSDGKDFEEKDLYADVYVGRFPASTKEELRTMVRKQLSYEKNPAPGSWTSSMFLAGSLMDTPNDPVQYQPYKDNSYELVLKVEEDLPKDVTPFHLVDYPQLDYGGYNVMFDSLNRSSFEAYYRTGFSTVLVACHGDPYNGNCTNYKGKGGGRWSYIRDYEEHFTYDMAETIRNGERLPLVYISSCASSNFTETDDTNMERLLRNPDGGAIALIGASVDTYRGEFKPDQEHENSTDSYGNWYLAREYFKLLYGGHPRPGEALYMEKWNYQLHNQYDLGKEIDLEKYAKIFNVDSLAYNLLGDPEGPIWIDTPRELNLSVPDSFDHETGLEVSVHDSITGTPIKGAVVTLTDPGNPDVYCTSLTSSSGIATLTPDLHSLGIMRVVAQVDGYIPLSRSVKATSNWDAEIDPDIRFIPDPPVLGEPFTAVFTIRNNGNNRIDNLFFYWTWYSSSGVPPKNNTFHGIGVGNLTIERTIDWKIGDDTILHAWVEIFPSKLESDDRNNMASRTFRVNRPIELNLMNMIELDEDHTFLEKWGERLDLFSLNRVVDNDPDSFPQPLHVWAESLSDNISIDQDQTDQSFDIIPKKDWSGEGNIRFYATDGSVIKSGVVKIIVDEIPDPPRFIKYPKIFQGAEDVRSNFTVEVYDVDSILVDLNTSVPWATVERVVKGHLSEFNISIIPTDKFTGDNFITLTAVDDSGIRVEQTITVNVKPTNDPPSILSPSRINATRGQNMDIDLQVEDPDGDTQFIVNTSWEYGQQKFEYTNFTVPIPEDASLGEHSLIVTVDDGNGGVSRFVITVNLRDRERSDYSVVLVIMMVVIFIFLFVYGVFLRMQERKQKRILDSVGINAPLEARSLSEKDFKRRKKKRNTAEGLPMPPAPLEVEGALAREEKIRNDRQTNTQRTKNDMELDMDDVLSEFFP